MSGNEKENGSAVNILASATANIHSGTPALTISHLSSADHIVKDASITVHTGRITGMFGLCGSGRTEFLECIYGIRRISGGTIEISGAKNAAVLAAQILAVSDDALAAKLDAQRSEMAEQIAAKEAKLQAELAH